MLRHVFVTLRMYLETPWLMLETMTIFSPSQGRLSSLWHRLCAFWWQTTGRFTNGRTISDIIGEALGNKSFPPPYLSDSLSNAVLGGLNYASGASGILDQTGTLFIGKNPLGAQISYFEQTTTYMVSAMGENGTRTFLSKALFSLTIGSMIF
ncbi:GDSL esterase/lipase [Camellia lanceoleosa]|uniref:GDSL esterase/lipase n=1 Tax=Camellia lanceoleosa TaxID=1840588 RepID=A0ACC0G0B1_9ERIC|nr:GDSL esterase/lipase [Camellia lanceoleosa]